MGKKHLILAAYLALSAPFCFGAGETAADILKTPSGARALGMGEAYTASVMCPDAVDYNPAGIAFIKNRKAAVTHQILYPGLSEAYAEHAAYAQKLDNSFIEGYTGISFNYRWMENIDNEDAVDEPVSYNDFSLAGVYAAPLKLYLSEDFLKHVYTGLAVKFISQTVGLYQGSTAAVDIGAIWAPEGENGLKIGIAALNMGLPLRLIRPSSDTEESTLGDFPLPLTLRAGIAARAAIDADNSAVFAFDYIQDFYDYAKFAAGFEYSLAQTLFLRAGYNTYIDTSNPAYASFGAGILVNQFDVTAGIDYTYRIVLWGGIDAPAGNHVISLKAEF